MSASCEYLDTGINVFSKVRDIEAFYCSILGNIPNVSLIAQYYMFFAQSCSNQRPIATEKNFAIIRNVGDDHRALDNMKPTVISKKIVETTMDIKIGKEDGRERKDTHRHKERNCISKCTR